MTISETAGSTSKRVALTVARLEAAKPAEKRYELHDAGARGRHGLFIRVSPTGRRTWYFRRKRGESTYRLGDYPAITLEMARCGADSLYQALQEGRDPRGNEPPVAVQVTWGNFVDELYAPHFRAHHRNDRGLSNLKGFDHWRDLPLSEITRIRVQRWRTDRLNQEVRASTVNRNIAALKAALSFSVAEGLLEANPLAGLKRLPVDESSRVRYLSQDEEVRLWAALTARETRIREARISANKWRSERGYALLPDLSGYRFADHLLPMVIVSINTGIRRGELFHLRWSDVVDEVLTVQSGKSKSRKTRRIPLNSVAADAIAAWRLQSGSKRYVFEGREGQPFDNIKHCWSSVLTEASIKDFRWHDLRHHFASMLVMGGHAKDADGETDEERTADRRLKQRQRAVPLNTVRELLGHSDLQMTLRYAHLAPGQLRDAVEVLAIAPPE